MDLQRIKKGTYVALCKKLIILGDPDFGAILGRTRLVTVKKSLEAAFVIIDAAK